MHNPATHGTNIKINNFTWEVPSGVERAYTYDTSLHFLYVGIPSTATLK
jgi:hypothetical protein